MIETTRLIIADRELKDIPIEEHYLDIYPEIHDLDPAIGECRNPVFYSIFTKDVNRHIGLCCLYNFTDVEVELGVRIFIPEYWGKGYGAEVVNALCEYAFSCSPQITAVLAKAVTSNTRAIRCYEKCQFEQYSWGDLEGYNMAFMIRRR